VIEELRTNHRDVRQPCRSSDAHSRQLSDLESPFDNGGYVIAQFTRSLQCSFDPDNFHLAGRDVYRQGFSQPCRTGE
jgi:hypothetical protein